MDREHLAQAAESQHGMLLHALIQMKPGCAAGVQSQYKDRRQRTPMGILNGNGNQATHDTSAGHAAGTHALISGVMHGVQLTGCVRVLVSGASIRSAW